MIEDIVRETKRLWLYIQIFPAIWKGLLIFVMAKVHESDQSRNSFILIPQLINYYKSVFTYADPDKPEGLIHGSLSRYSDFTIIRN